MEIWLRFRVIVQRPVTVILLALIGLTLVLDPALSHATDWEANVGAESHTLTFLCPDPPGNCKPTGRPPFATAPVTPNNVVYDGKEFVNSGVLSGGDSYTVEFAATGTFSFVCLVHGRQNGTVHVRDAGVPYPLTQQAYDRDAGLQGGALLLQAQLLQKTERDVAGADPADAVVIGSGFYTVLGVGHKPSCSRAFTPRPSISRRGETVTWTTDDPATPHTVTFGPEPDVAANPIGTDEPGHATLPTAPPGQAVSSGFMGVGPGRPGGTAFQVTFTQPGIYHYICVLHDELGMVGTVTVSQ